MRGSGVFYVRGFPKVVVNNTELSEGQTVRLEKLDIATGETIEFAEVLMIANGEEVKIGVPFVDGGVIKAEVVAHGRGEKVKIVKVSSP